jgi:hypothetical protein
MIEEKRTNPSNYSLVVLSEGARWEGYEAQEYGKPDAYGRGRWLSRPLGLSAYARRSGTQAD